MHWTIPNLLTLLRVALIPVVVFMYYLPVSGLYGPETRLASQSILPVRKHRQRTTR